MARVKGGNIHASRRKKVLKLAKGYFGSKHRLYKSAKEQVMHSLKYAYRDRKNNKREFRKLWITRINAACRMNDMSYSRFINGLLKANIVINRKMLAELAISNPAAFTELTRVSKAALEGKDLNIKTLKATKEVKEVKEEKVTPAKKETVKKETTTKAPAKKVSVKEEK